MPTPETAVVHPLVLLSVVDHYNRVARDTQKRVVGILLGEQSKGRVQVTNSFAGEWGTWEKQMEPAAVQAHLHAQHNPNFGVPKVAAVLQLPF